MIGRFVFQFHLYQSFSETGNTYMFSINIPEIQLITSSFILYYWTEDLMEWLTCTSGHKHHYLSYLQ